MPENGGKDCIGESLQISQCSEVNCSGKEYKKRNNTTTVLASIIIYQFPF
jgi:hypothetical protein